MIDIRSDTVTIPTQAMRNMMSSAEVGDDVFAEDKTVNRLQEYVADILGKEDALFVPSGTMSNQICLALHSHAGDEAIVEGESHIFHYETGAPSLIARVQLYCVPSQKGEMKSEDVQNAIRPGDYYFPRTAVICVENTHNRHGGTIVSLRNLEELKAIAQANNCVFHCDGARLWNAEAATGISVREYASYFDTLSVCLSKGLGAPAGSLVVGNREHVKAARKWRKMLGGGMRQAGILAAGGLYALENNRSLLQYDHANAQLFAELLEQSECVTVLAKPETNIVLFAARNNQFIEQCKEKGLLISRGRPGLYRAVFHFQISENQTRQAADIVREVAEER